MLLLLLDKFSEDVAKANEVVTDLAVRSMIKPLIF